MYSTSQLKAMFYTPPVLALDCQQYFFEPPSQFTMPQPLVPTSTEDSFVHCPQDIARIIFEMAMEDRPLPVHLALVSRQVKEWVDPFIYRTLSFCDPICFNSFYRNTFHKSGSSLISKDRNFYKKHVKGLFVHAYASSDRLAEVVREMTGIEALALVEANSGEDAMRRILMDYPSSKQEGRPHRGNRDNGLFPFQNLRRLSFSSCVLQTRLNTKIQLTFSHRFFKDITHMDMYFYPKVDWEALHQLHNLTHISFNDMVSSLRHPSSRTWDNWMTRLLNACPPSVQVVIFGCIDSYNYNFYMMGGDEEYLPGRMVIELCEFVTGNGPRNKPGNHLKYHAISRLIAGWMHSRAVAACLGHGDLPKDHIFYDRILVGSNRPFGPVFHVDDWAHAGDGLVRDCWSMAEDLIERRKRNDLACL